MSDTSTKPLTGPLPPEPFTSWVDYAVAHLPARDLELDGMFNDGEQPAYTRDDFRRVVQSELDALRARAGDPDSFPEAFRIPPIVTGHP